ncbi:MAG TPA: histidine ammonia-lyase [Herpetosiphonaceae bacterium]
MQTILLDGEHLTIEAVVQAARDTTARVGITEAACGRMERSRAAVDRFVAEGAVIYGITTGFGKFQDRVIPSDEVEQLQRNIVMSHAVGTGPLLDPDVVRAMILVRANTLAKGVSGIRPLVVERLLDLLHHDLIPLVPAQGSLGSSGDLAPLAHIALVLIGMGEAQLKGTQMPGAEALAAVGWEPLTLQAKEGLALTNGTALMAGLGALVIHDSEVVCRTADVAAALSFEAMAGVPMALDPRIHAARPHPRQMECAAFLRRVLDGSALLWGGQGGQQRAEQNVANLPPHLQPAGWKVQDAYSLRCTPQVHGAVRDSVAYARWAIEIELNSATDNPLIFVDEAGQVEALSGGNFHGEPLALALDYLALGLTELGNISERRLARLLDPARHGGLLPPFLIEHGGLNSGLMLVQYTAAALASENKVLAHPASADTIPTSAGQEDHNSMGATAARQAHAVLCNLQTIVACEALAACQAIDLRWKLYPEHTREMLNLGRGTAAAYALIRQHVPFLEADAVLYPYIEAVRRLVASGALCNVVETALAGE